MKKIFGIGCLLLLLIKLSGCSEEDIEYALSDTPNLNGEWELTMPAGFKQQSSIEYMGDLRYRIPLKGNLGGVYEEQGHTLKMFNPGNDVRQHYVWKVEHRDSLILVEAPPVAKVGSDYRGATLVRRE